MEEPLVSICCITYNHAKFIRECLEGFLLQETSFSYEVIIHDDASTDETRKIIDEYVNKFPNIFIPVFQSENQYSKGNRGIYAKFVYPLVKGEYIAMCEGDDYWTDPLKLQKQVDFLLANQSVGLIYTRSRVYNEEFSKFNKKIIGRYFEGKKLFLSNPIPTLTTLYRTSLIKQYIIEVNPSEKNWKMGDYPMWLWFFINSKIVFLNDITTTYRLLKESASHSSNSQKMFDFNTSSFEIADFFAKPFLNGKEYQYFQEKRLFSLYLSSLKNRISDHEIYYNKIKDLEKISLKGKLLLFLLENIKGRVIYKKFINEKSIQYIYNYLLLLYSLYKQYTTRKSHMD